MSKSKKQQKKIQQAQEQMQEESVLSSEDDDGVLLTSRVQQKLLSTLAKIKMRDPSIYLVKTPLYEQSDFQASQKSEEVIKKKQSKFTYKDMMRQSDHSADEQEKELTFNQEQRKAKQLFKKALSKNIQKLKREDDDLFTIKTKIVKEEKTIQEVDQKAKFKDLTKSFDKETKKMIKKVWKSDQLDETDLFLKNYILDKKWLTSKYKENKTEEEVKIDQEDEQRSEEMDKFQATYNFRFQEPGGTQITQYPRSVRNSLRQKPETRKEKRKKMMEKKKEQDQKVRKQATKRKQTLKQNILDNLIPEAEEDGGHDWFFCDDCCKPLQEGEHYFQCQDCEDYMLCRDCNQLIIHKHKLNKGKIPKGFGPPNTSLDVLQELKTCNKCRRRIVPTKKKYQFLDKTYVLNTMCEQCFDQSNLETKKKYKEVQAQILNYEQILQQNPEKIKQLTNKKEIQDMVDEYLKNQFEDVIADGFKTKFKYMTVPAESYGLSDEQILYGDDKELNKYISIKKLAPYRDGSLRLRNSYFNQKIKTIKKSVKVNKKLLEKGIAKFNKVRLLNKVKNRASAVRQRRQKKLRILNLSNQQRQRNFFIPSGRLQSYGIKTGQNAN